MKYILSFLTILSIVGISYGFYLRPEETPKGDVFIGLSLVLLFFITMPIFIYRRWKGKDVKDYMLNEENILKMREYNDSKDKK